MGDDFVDYAVREGVQTGDLPPGTANAQTVYVYFRRVNRLFDLVKNGTITLSGSTHRIPAGKQINARQHGFVLGSQQHRLGGG